jgi:hydrogenase expression/formation protein HypC
MCLAIPGKVLEIDRSGPLAMGRVDFGGIRKDVCLEWMPDVAVGEYVIVHVGFAISKMNEEEALKTLDILRQMEGGPDELGPDDAAQRDSGLPGQEPEPPAGRP